MMQINGSLLRRVVVISLYLSIIALGAGCGPKSLQVNNEGADALLPRSLKGYELYVWEEAGVVRLTLVTGTNREKQLEEIVSKDSNLSSDGWFKGTVEGLDQGLDLLARLAPGETVIVMSLPVEEGEIDLETYQSPPTEVFTEIAEFCREKGLELILAIEYGK